MELNFLKFEIYLYFWAIESWYGCQQFPFIFKSLLMLTLWHFGTQVFSFWKIFLTRLQFFMQCEIKITINVLKVKLTWKVRVSNLTLYFVSVSAFCVRLWNKLLLPKLTLFTVIVSVGVTIFFILTIQILYCLQGMSF